MTARETLAVDSSPHTLRNVVESTHCGGRAPPVERACLDEPTAHETRTLNSLIVGLLDNIDEYRRAIFAVEQRLNSMQRELFQRSQAVEQLQAHVRSIGGQPATCRSTLGLAFASVLAARNPFMRDNERELVQDAERGDRAIQERLQRCLESELSDQGRHCIADILQNLRGPHREAWSAQNIVPATFRLGDS